MSERQAEHIQILAVDGGAEPGLQLGVGNLRQLIFHSDGISVRSDLLLFEQIQTG